LISDNANIMKDAQSIILSFNKSISPNDRIAKYKAIQESTFRFYRGTCHLFYDRLASIGAPEDGTRAWICGDLHLENFGTFKGDNRLVYFDLNDFDEAVMAPLSLEVLRFATAILIASDLFKYSDKQAKRLVISALGEYRDTILLSKALMLERETAKGFMRGFFEHLSLSKRQEFIRRITLTGGKKLKLKIDGIHNHGLEKDAYDKFIKWYKDECSEVKSLSDMKILDCAYRVAGTGSIGCERYMILAQNRKSDKYYLMDMKEARPSSLLPHISIMQPKWRNEAQRVIAIQSRMQFCSPALLHPVQYHDKWFVLKELQPLSDKVDLTQAKGKLSTLEDIIHPMAKLAAYAHLRSTGRQESSTADELAEAVSHPKWLSQRFELAQGLAEQTRKDYKAFLKYKIV
jgi:uncharacterized protein (DUF2252 family)